MNKQKMKRGTEAGGIVAVSSRQQQHVRACEVTRRGKNFWNNRTRGLIRKICEEGEASA